MAFCRLLESEFECVVVPLRDVIGYVHGGNASRALGRVWGPGRNGTGFSARTGGCGVLRLKLPPPTLLLRRMELQTLSVLGELRAGGDWAALAAEHGSDQRPSTPLGREDTAFFERHDSAARRDDSREST